MDKNKVHYDLANVHAAKLTIAEDGTPSWGVPKRIPGAISIELSANGDIVKLRADGTDYYVVSSNNGYEGDMNLALVPDWFRVEMLGDTISEKDKVLVENAQSSQAAFALLFEFFGDKKHRRHVLYNCVASRPNVQGENKDNQKEADTESLTITASPLEDGRVKASTTEETPEQVYHNWFQAIWEKDSDENTGGEETQ